MVIQRDAITRSIKYTHTLLKHTHVLTQTLWEYVYVWSRSNFFHIMVWDIALPRRFPSFQNSYLYLRRWTDIMITLTGIFYHPFLHTFSLPNIPSPQILSSSFHSSFAVSEPFSQEFRSHTLLFASLLSIILDLSFCGRQSNEDLQEISVMEVGVYCTIVKRGIMPH